MFHLVSTQHLPWAHPLLSMRALSLLMSPLMTISWIVSIFSRNSGTLRRNLFSHEPYLLLYLQESQGYQNNPPWGAVTTPAGRAVNFDVVIHGRSCSHPGQTGSIIPRQCIVGSLRQSFFQSSHANKKDFQIFHTRIKCLVMGVSKITVKHSIIEF